MNGLLPNNDHKRFTGIVKTWITSQGFGFVCRDDYFEEDIFVSVFDVPARDKKKTLHMRERVEFEIRTKPTGHRYAIITSFPAPQGALAQSGHAL